jgi:hypothetical protein
MERNIMKYLLILMALINVSGCDKDRHIPIATADLLSVTARTELKLPPEGQLTLGTNTDIEFVAKLTPETLKAVERCLKSTGRKFIINAARPVGNHLLLWIGFPDVADSGVDLIWSVEKQKPVGTFTGGYRG